MPLSKETVRGWKPKVIETPEVPALGDSVYIRELSVAERNRWVAFLAPFAFGEKVEADDAMERMTDQALWLVATSVCEQDGTPLFDGPDDDAFRWLPREAFAFIREQIEELNGLTKEAANEIEGN